MTILEVMVAVTVVVVMGLVIAESMTNAVEYQRLLEDRDVTIRQARVAMSKLRREIELAYLTPSQLATETIETVFVGMDEEPDKLYFASMSHQRIYRDAREADQAEITIWAERATEEQGHGYVLFHREAGRVDEEPDEGGIVYPLAYNVRSFNLRYLDPQDGEWKEEWDTRSSETLYRLPRAVELGLVLIAPDPTDKDRTVDVPFLTTVGLHYGGRLQNLGNPLANRAQQSLFGGNGNPLMVSPIAGNFGGFGSGTLPGARPTPRGAGGTPSKRMPAGSPRRGSDGQMRVTPQDALFGGRK